MALQISLNTPYVVQATYHNIKDLTVRVNQGQVEFSVFGWASQDASQEPGARPLISNNYTLPSTYDSKPGVVVTTDFTGNLFTQCYAFLKTQIETYKGATDI